MDATMKPLQERVAEALESFKAECWREPWDTTIVRQDVSRASRGSGLAVFTRVRDGITFETAILPTDNVPAALGAAVH